MVCYPYTAHGRTVHLSHSLLASRAPSISITLNALPITMVATEKPRSPGSPPPTIRTHRAEPTRVHDRSTSRRRERRCVEVPRPAAAACRNGALGGAAVAAERAESARKFDGVPAVGPDEGPGSKTRAEAAVWGHGEPRRERSAPYLTRSVGWTTQLTDPTRAQTQPNPKSTILLLGPQSAHRGG